jgi:hypothetical protein
MPTGRPDRWEPSDLINARSPPADRLADGTVTLDSAGHAGYMGPELPSDLP